MDRAAPTNLPPDIAAQLEWETARKLGLLGVGLGGAAAALGLVAAAASLPAFVSTARILLSLCAALAAGSGLAARPDRWQAWALAAGGALLAAAGLPGHWDSFRFMLVVFAAVAAGGAAVRTAAPEWRARVLSVVLAFHFFGIFLATTAHPTPWLNDQLFQRIYNPYLQFVYMRNAYHFYSPDPGPASLIVCMLKTETAPQTYEYKWVIMPKRPGDFKGPLGLAYYRRLSLTEQIARATPASVLPESFEKSELTVRRRESPIPAHPVEPLPFQYRQPHPDLIRYVLPSYARHVILEYTADKDAAARTTVKMYRMEHRTLNVLDFKAGNDPYFPATYRAYFLGEFNALGTLVDPQERLLYWLLPVVPKTGPDAKPKDYIDYLSAHALGAKIEDMEKPANAANALDWKQLR